MQPSRSRARLLRRILAASLSTATLLFLVGVLLRYRRRMLPQPAAGEDGCGHHESNQQQAAEAEAPDRPALAPARREASAPPQREGVERRCATAELLTPAPPATKPLLASAAGDRTVVATPGWSGVTSPVEEEEGVTTPQWLRLAAQVLPAEASASPNGQAAHEAALAALAALAQAAVVNEAAASLEAGRFEAGRSEAGRSPTGVMERAEAEAAAAEEAVNVVAARAAAAARADVQLARAEAAASVRRAEVAAEAAAAAAAAAQAEVEAEVKAAAERHATELEAVAEAVAERERRS